MKTLTVIAMLFVIMLSAVAQADVVYLNNGASFRGRIIFENDTSLTLELPYGEMDLDKKDIQSIQRESPGEYYLGSADDYFANENYLSAVAQYRKVLELDPENKKAQSNLITSLIKLGEKEFNDKNYDEAYRFFKQVMDIDARDETAGEYIRTIRRTILELQQTLEDAEVYLYMGSYNKARQILRENAQDIPSTHTLYTKIMSRSYVGMGNIALRQGKYDEAVNYYQQAINVLPTISYGIRDNFLFAYLSWLSERIKPDASNTPEQWRQFRDELIDMQKIYPDDMHLRYFLGFVYIAQKQYFDAYQELAFIVGVKDEYQGNPGTLNDLQKRAKAKIDEQAFNVEFFPVPAEFEDYSPGDFSTFTTTHFRIFCKNEKMGRLASKIFEYYLNHIGQTLADKDGDFTYPEVCDVYIYSTKAMFLSETSMAPWSTGHTSIKIENNVKELKIMTYQTAPELFESVVPHELTHLIVPYLLNYPENIPLWMQEGLSVSFEHPLKLYLYTYVIENALSENTLIPYVDIITTDKYPGEDRIDLFYAQSLFLIKYLEAQKDRKTFLDFAQAACGGGIEKALQRFYGLTVDDIEKQIEDFLDFKR